MIKTDLSELKAVLRAGQRLMGLDLGEKTIGLALSDTLLTVATPFQTLKRGKFAADARGAGRADRGAWRRRTDRRPAAEHGRVRGTLGPVGPRLCAAISQKVSDCPLAFMDERLSTAAVTRTLIEADASRRRRSEVVDKMAAAYILQAALDRMRHLPPSP